MAHFQLRLHCLLFFVYELSSQVGPNEMPGQVCYFATFFSCDTSFGRGKTRGNFRLFSELSWSPCVTGDGQHFSTKAANLVSGFIHLGALPMVMELGENNKNSIDWRVDKCSMTYVL